MALNSNIELALINTNVNAGSLTLPSALSAQGRVITFKDSVGKFGTNTLTLSTTGSDTFEDGGTTKILRENYGVIQLVASDLKWYVLTGIQQNTLNISTVQALSISSINISTANVFTSSLQFTTSNAIYQNSTLSIYNSNVFAGSRVYPQTVLNRITFSPFSLNGLQFWFDASDRTTQINSGTQILTWRDKSGNGYNASGTLGTVPTLNSGALNSLNTLTFNGTNQFYTLVNNFDIGNNNNIFACVVNIAVQGTPIVRTILGKGVVPAPSFAINAFYNSVSFPGQAQYNYYPVNNVFTNAINSFTGLSSGWNIIVYTVTSGFQSLYANGTLSSTNNVSALQIYATGLTYLGKNGSDETSYYNSDIAEILMIFDNPNTLRRQQIEGYLAWKWGLQGNLPASHPYKNAPPT